MERWWELIIVKVVSVITTNKQRKEFPGRQLLYQELYARHIMLMLVDIPFPVHHLSIFSLTVTRKNCTLLWLLVNSYLNLIFILIL